MGKRQIKVGQYYTEKGNIPGYKKEMIEILAITKEGYLFGRVIYFFETSPYKSRELGYDVYLSGWPNQKEFLSSYRSLSKQNYLRRIISESIDTAKITFQKG